MSNIDGLNHFFGRINNLFSKFESQNEFKEAEGWIYGVLYDLYSKTKRAFISSQLVLNSDIPNSYIEVLPQLRIILESYLHSDYIRLNIKDIHTIEQEYKEHLKYQQWRFGKILYELKEELNKINKNNLGDYEDIIYNHYLNKERPQYINHLENIKELSKKVRKFDVYAKVYTILSTYIHYNPITRISYGSAEGDTFVFNRFKYDENLGIQIRTYLAEFTLGVIRNTMLVFSVNKEFLFKEFVPVEKDFRLIDKLI